MPRYGGYYYGMPSPVYWRQRAKERLDESFKSAGEAEEYLKQVYQSNLINFLKEYNKLLKPYTKNGQVDGDAVKRATLGNPEFIYRYFKLQEHIADMCKQLFNINKEKTETLLKHVYKVNAEGIIRDLHKPKSIKLLDKKAIETAVKQPWTKDGREFSDRIWEHQEWLNRELRRRLSDAITQGKSIESTSREFRDIFGTTYYCAERLIRTQTLAVYAKSSRNTYEEYGIEYMKIMLKLSNLHQ